MLRHVGAAAKRRSNTLKPQAPPSKPWHTPASPYRPNSKPYRCLARLPRQSPSEPMSSPPTYSQSSTSPVCRLKALEPLLNTQTPNEMNLRTLDHAATHARNLSRALAKWTL